MDVFNSVALYSAYMPLFCRLSSCSHVYVFTYDSHSSPVDVAVCPQRADVIASEWLTSDRCPIDWTGKTCTAEAQSQHGKQLVDTDRHDSD